jgi:hypothetical protein
MDLSDAHAPLERWVIVVSDHKRSDHSLALIEAIAPS